MNHILANHSTYGRPVQDPDQAVNVSIQLYLTQMLRMVSKRFYLDFSEDIPSNLLITMHYNDSGVMIQIRFENNTVHYYV